MSLYDHHSEKQERPTLGECSNLLQSEVGRFSRVFVITDALDERSEGNHTRGDFLAEIRKLQPSINLLVTSQHISTIEREFEMAARVEIFASDGDIRTYLESRIERERRLLRHVKADPGMRETIINAIAEKAKGM